MTGNMDLRVDLSRQHVAAIERNVSSCIFFSRSFPLPYEFLDTAAGVLPVGDVTVHLELVIDLGPHATSAYVSYLR